MPQDLSLPAARNQLHLFIFYLSKTLVGLGEAGRGTNPCKAGLRVESPKGLKLGMGGGASSPFQRVFNRKQMLRARAPKAGSAAGFPGSTLPTESVLIKIFQFKHKARGRGSREGSRGDMFVTSAQAEGFGAGLEGVLGCTGSGWRPHPVPPA